MVGRGGEQRRWACGADERVGVAVARGAWRGGGARCVRAVWWAARVATVCGARGRASVRVCSERRVSRGAPVESVWRCRWVVQRSAGGVSRMLTC